MLLFKICKNFQRQRTSRHHLQINGQLRKRANPLAQRILKGEFLPGDQIDVSAVGPEGRAGLSFSVRKA